jgi:hypothetical protein
MAGTFLHGGARKRELRAAIRLVTVLGVLATILAVLGCGSDKSARGETAGSAQVDYASYGGCVGCKGTVPAALRRPLHLPRSARPCPVSPWHPSQNGISGEALGTGPVFAGADLGNRYLLQPPPTKAAGRWGYFKILWSVRGYRGPLLIRGQQIGGPDGLGFGDPEFPPRPELQIAPREPGTPTPSGSRDPWRFFPSAERVTAPGCYGLQIDGTSFSKVIVIRVVS